MDELWPSLEAEAPRASLDMALSRLRKLLELPDAVRWVDGQLLLEAPWVWTDVAAFEARCEAAEAVGAQAGTALTEALALYTAPLLGNMGGAPRLRGRVAPPNARLTPSRLKNLHIPGKSAAMPFCHRSTPLPHIRATVQGESLSSLSPLGRLRSTAGCLCLAASAVVPALAQPQASPDLGIGYFTVAYLGGAGDLGPIQPSTDLSRLNADIAGKNGERASLRTHANEDGSTTMELTTSADLPALFLVGRSKVSLTTKGLCPDAAGRVALTVKVSQGGQAGSGNNVVYDRETEVRIQATVGEDAELAQADLRSRQGERSTEGGRAVYLEGEAEWGQQGTGERMRVQERAARLVRHSSQAQAADKALFDKGLKRALNIASGALQAAAYRWQSGACIRIDATSPGNVRPKASTTIPVRVLHRLDGTETPARVTVSLSGGASVTPELIPRSPGSLTHVAPAARGARISILLTANSRRGRAEQRLVLTVDGGMYRIEGGADEFSGTGTVCDLARPFTVQGSGVVVSFVPASAQGGSYKYKGTMSGFPVWGEGRYTVQYAGDQPVGISASGPGSVKTPMGVVSRSGAEKYAVSPASSGTCP